MKRYKLVKYNDNVENFGTLQEDEFGDLVRFEDANEIIHRFELFTGIHRENLNGIDAKNIEEQIDSFSEALCECHAKLEKVSQWVSVKDRLPEDTNDVLVFFRDDDGSWHIDNVCHDGFGWTFYGEQVTHWMPLPEPPDETTGNPPRQT